MISYAELSQFSIQSKSNVNFTGIYSNDGVITANVILSSTKERLMLHPVGVGQLWRNWVDPYKHNIGKLLCFILGRPVTVYGYIHLDRPKNPHTEYPMFVGVWLDYRDAHELVCLQYSVGFNSNGVFCFDIGSPCLIQNVGFPNNPITFEPIVNTQRILKSHAYTYSNDFMPLIFDVNAFKRIKLGWHPWPPAYNFHHTYAE